MELVETIASINFRLKRDFGRLTDGTAEWKVVLAGEQTEKRRMDVTDDGFALLHPEVRLVRKYQHIPPNYYVLERNVPVMGDTDLVTPTSDEPAWTFQDRFGNYLPPRFDACKFIIESIYSKVNSAGTHKKYKDPEDSPEIRLQKLLDMEHALFGEETPVTDALHLGYGVAGFTPSPEMTQKQETNSSNEEKK